MTVTEQPAAPVRDAAAPGRSRWRRSLPYVLVGAAFVVAVALAVAAQPKAEQKMPYDPSSTQPDGTRALVEVLREHGVDVDIARSAAELDGTHPGPDTTVMVTQSELLGRPSADRLRELAADSTRVVVAAPDPYVTRLLDGPDLVNATDRLLSPRCDDPMWKGVRLRSDDAHLYQDTRAGCFVSTWKGGKGAVLVPAGGLWIWGAPDAFSNEQILRADNAAIGLRMLGAHKHLVWYVPSYTDVAAGQGHSVGDLIPRWIPPALWLALLAVAALAFARGRRLGPLAVEPLPVSVRADETTRTLGRLYRRAGDRRHAAQVLRRAARGRLAERLQLGRGASADDVVRVVAARTGRSHSAVAELLLGAPPAAGTGSAASTDLGSGSRAPMNDRDLIALADDLAALEEELRP